MAEAAEPHGESHGAEVKIQQPAEKLLRGQPRRGRRSVLKVSQLLLQAITSHRGLTLAALKKELGNAGYEVRSKNFRPWGEAPRPEVKGTLLRVSGSDAAGYFRVWKIPRPKKKPDHPRFDERHRSSRRTRAGTSGPRRRRTRRRRAARKAREVWRQSSKADGKTKRVRSRARGLGRSCTGEAMEGGRSRTTKGESKPRTREERRPGPRPKEEKNQDVQKLVKRTVQKPTPLKVDQTSSEQGKTLEIKAARSKVSAKSECPRNATGNS
ncbi:testis-specific H1 histone [Choloepus didactylus]|uniref:testis-specific H1 histone n=1 Tax=Choloepus didactylus TaxID=27675 RepID=UPI00189CD18B|nr:testis-specific H1 histone [Choloepus didactylus]